jgi:hypothetical protein
VGQGAEPPQPCRAVVDLVRCSGAHRLPVDRAKVGMLAFDVGLVHEPTGRMAMLVSSVLFADRKRGGRGKGRPEEDELCWDGLYVPRSCRWVAIDDAHVLRIEPEVELAEWHDRGG